MSSISISGYSGDPVSGSGSRNYATVSSDVFFFDYPVGRRWIEAASTYSLSADGSDSTAQIWIKYTTYDTGAPSSTLGKFSRYNDVIGGLPLSDKFTADYWYIDPTSPNGRTRVKFDNWEPYNANVNNPQKECKMLLSIMPAAEGIRCLSVNHGCRAANKYGPVMAPINANIKAKATITTVGTFTDIGPIIN